jgi:hypothetical protein
MDGKHPPFFDRCGPDSHISFISLPKSNSDLSILGLPQQRKAAGRIEPMAGEDK